MPRPGEPAVGPVAAEHVKSHLDFRLPCALIGARQSNEIPVASCPTCNHDSAIGARFCSRCGTVLPRRICQTCGTANEVDALRCIECGEALRLAMPMAAPMQAEEAAVPHEMGPMARLAELNARSSALAPAPSAPVAAAMARTPVDAAHVVSAAAEPATRNAGNIGNAAGAAGAVTASPPVVRAETEDEAVDLYLDLPRAPAALLDAPTHSGPAHVPGSAPVRPEASPQADESVQWTPADAGLSAAAPPARRGPFAIGAAVLAFGVAVAGGAWLWQRSAQPPPSSSVVRPAADRVPAPLGAPAKPDPEHAVQTPPRSGLPTGQAARPSARMGASAPAQQRGDGVDAAADAALAAAERALASQGRQAPPGASPAAKPRPPTAAASATGRAP